LDWAKSIDVAFAASDQVIAAAGDIACDPNDSHYNGGSGDSIECRQKYTSDLLVNAGLSAVLDLGDNQYYCGSYDAYMKVYDHTWGRVKSITHPSAGNHEYLTASGSYTATGCDSTNQGAAGYFQYFGSVAGQSGQGYYSYSIGTWHVVVLNSNCSDAGGCTVGTPQYQWLQNDLATHSNYCTLAYWHIPVFSSGGRASPNAKPLFQLLYNYDADLILNGHDHIYERFAPQDPTGAKDTAKGIREFVVGTGGSDHTSIPGAIWKNSEILNNNTFGVLKLTLHSASYDWKFVPEAGWTFTDSGNQSCHQNVPDTTSPSNPIGLLAKPVAWNQVNLSWTASIDNIGVTTYKIFRNGVQIATSSRAYYTDKTTQPLTTYSYYVRAVDAAGNVSGASNTASVTTPAVSSSLTLMPTADAYVRSDLPMNNYGTATQIGIDSSPAINTFLKFSVLGVGTQKITSVKLRLYCVNSSPFGGEFRRATSSAWGETTINWGNAPAAGTTVYGTLGSVVNGGWYEVDVTSAITGDGTYTFRISSTLSDGAYYTSKEGASGYAPQLVISLGALSATATVAPTPRPTATATPQSSTLFRDGFESGTLSNWTSSSGLVVQNQEVASGNYAARGTSAAGPATYARKTLSIAQTDIYYAIRFKLISQGSNSIYLMKMRTAANGSIVGFSISSTGKLSYRNDMLGTTFTSATTVTKGSWQTFEAHLRIADISSQVEIWYNGTKLDDLSKTDSLGTNPIGILQLGENTSGLTYDIAFDDVSASLKFITMAATTSSASPSILSITAPTSTPTPTLASTSIPAYTSTLMVKPSATPSSTPTQQTSTPIVLPSITPTTTPTKKVTSTPTSTISP
jgi:hypothetical protein